MNEEPSLSRHLITAAILAALAPGLAEAVRHGDRNTGWLILGIGVLAWMAITPPRR